MTFHQLRKYDLVYLSSPYSLHPRGRDVAFAEICKVAGDLIAEGVKVFSPIAHSHAICRYCDDVDPLDHVTWLEQDEAVIGACDAMVIVELESWENSFGIAAEVDLFRLAEKPIHHLNPVTMELR